MIGGGIGCDTTGHLAESAESGKNAFKKPDSKIGRPFLTGWGLLVIVYYKAKTGGLPGCYTIVGYSTELLAQVLVLYFPRFTNQSLRPM